MTEQNVNIAPMRRTVARCTVPCLALAAALLAGCGGDAPDAAGPVTKPSPPAAPKVKELGLGRKPRRGEVARNPAGWPPVELEPAVMDFGVLAPGQTARGTSRIWNVGSAPLKIIKSITSCGCTAAENLGGRVIPPGGHTEFTTEMTMKSGLGEAREDQHHLRGLYADVRDPVLHRRGEPARPPHAASPACVEEGPANRCVEQHDLGAD
jgi:hypothetical protein